MIRIEPKEITNFNRSLAEQQAFLLFAICVAGKRSSEIAPKVESFCNSLVDADEDLLTPFEGMRQLAASDLLPESLRDFRLGKYTVLEKACWDMIALGDRDLTEMSPGELEQIHGVGPKTSRFFLLHSRQGLKHVILDTHILEYAREIGIDAPKSTPQGSAYLSLEAKMIGALEGEVRDWADFDLNKWKQYSN
jgi:hypothetical protein